MDLLRELDQFGEPRCQLVCNKGGHDRWGMFLNWLGGWQLSVENCQPECSFLFFTGCFNWATGNKNFGSGPYAKNRGRGSGCYGANYASLAVFLVRFPSSSIRFAIPALRKKVD